MENQNKIKKIARWKKAKYHPITGKENQSGSYITGWTPMTKTDVAHYFSNIIPTYIHHYEMQKKWSEKKGKMVDKKVAIRYKYKIGEYCQRCGILIGEGHLCETPKRWEHFCLCDGCYEHKKNNEPENSPDLEDLERFRVKILNY